MIRGMTSHGAERHGDEDRRLKAARRLAEEFANHLDIDVAVRLWDGSVIPLGKNGSGDLAMAFNSPGVLTSLVRWPSLDRLIRHYAHGRIEIEGGTLVELGERIGSSETRRQLRRMSKLKLLRLARPLMFGRADRPDASRDFDVSKGGSSTIVCGGKRCVFGAELHPATIRVAARRRRPRRRPW